MKRNSYNKSSKNNSKNEDKYKKSIKDLLEKKLTSAKDQYGNQVGNHLGSIMQSAALDVVKLVVPRSAEKFLKPATFKKFINLLESGEITYEEIWNMSTSIANTLRPLAGNNFAKWVCDLLNDDFEQKNLSIKAIMSGPVKKSLATNLEHIDSEGMFRDLKPDLDIVVYHVETEKPLLIISCKTSLAERVMQTIRWKEFLSQLPSEIKNTKLFLVTAWEKYDDETSRRRVNVLDGVYAANDFVKESGKIKKFNKIYDDIAKLAKSPN